MKCNKNRTVTKTEISPKLKFIKTKISPNIKCHKKWNVMKTENVTKIEMLLKQKCYKNWKVTETKMLPNLKFHKIFKCPKNPNLSHNQNQGDRHRSPWSSFLIYMTIKINPLTLNLSHCQILAALILSCFALFWSKFTKNGTKSVSQRTTQPQ